MSPSTDHRESREFAAEIKFMLDRPLADRVREWARRHLAPDPHAADADGDGYQITSLYFDTDDFDVYHRRQSFGRCKYRIRRYGTSPAVFLERKLKTRGLVSKRRTLVPVTDLPLLAHGGPPRTWPGTWYADRLQLRQLHPVCQIQYRRTARVAMTARGPVRLTLDVGLQTVPIFQPGFVETGDSLALLPHQVILELKYRCEPPALFKQLIETLALSPSAVSKYRLATAALGLIPEPGPDLAPSSQLQPVCVCLTS